jgi:hypothetical protein
MGMSPSKISRIETGHSGLQPDDVSALLGFYEVSADKRADERGWWERQPGLPTVWRSLIDFENKATRIQNFEPLVIPGLLQTGKYCRELIAGVNPTLSETELDNLVASRMAGRTAVSRCLRRSARPVHDA